MKAILFDFDGTLANTAPGIVCTMQETFKALGLPVPDEGAIRQTIGLPLWRGIQLLGHFSEAEAEQGADVYRQLFNRFELTHITIFPGVAETIKELADRGIRMAICTSRGRESLDSILGRYGLEKYFETCITNSDHLPAKPAPDMVLALLERMHLQQAEAIVVGDTTFDIEMGNRAGCQTVAVTYGNHTREQLMEVHPTWMVDTFNEILSL